MRLLHVVSELIGFQEGSSPLAGLVLLHVDQSMQFHIGYFTV
jgi:hypothetical protein